MEQARDPLANVDPAASALLTAANAKKYCALPVAFKDGTLTIAVQNPEDMSLTDTLKFVIQGVKNFRFVKAEREALLVKISEVYAGGSTQPSGQKLTELIAPSIDIDQRAEKY